MTRKERRIKHRRVRRVLASLTALGVLGLGVGLAAPAGATKSGEGNCGKNDSYFETYSNDDYGVIYTYHYCRN
jgi:hypothetical protein